MHAFILILLLTITMIIHVDMDAFYASVEIRDNPQLAGKPVAVGGSPNGRGVVSAANYVAREYGVRSAMPAGKAARICPGLIFVRPRMEHYVSVSRQIREIFFRFTPLVEPLSLDEAFLDVAGSRDLFGSAEKIAERIKNDIRSELGLTASAGIAPNKFLAKIASDMDKPDGLVIVDEADVQDFLDPLDLRRVWGIGPSTEKRFKSLGVSNVAGIRGLPIDVLKRNFGVNFDHFWRLSRGLDTRPVVTERQAKSISHETTFARDVGDHQVLHAWVQELAGQVSLRMRKLEIKGCTVQLKIRFPDFRTLTRQSTFAESTNSTRKIETTSRELLEKILEQNHQPVRLIGTGVSGLNYKPGVQKTLFDVPEEKRDQRIDETCDELKRKFGNLAIRTGTSMEFDIRRQRSEVTEDRDSD